MSTTCSTSATPISPKAPNSKTISMPWGKGSSTRTASSAFPSAASSTPSLILHHLNNSL
ncbi:hypothetical protein LINPERPRIM_LOCUS1986 [Linum perenne]